jgi:hypothetical protein
LIWKSATPCSNASRPESSLELSIDGSATDDLARVEMMFSALPSGPGSSDALSGALRILPPADWISELIHTV